MAKLYRLKSRISLWHSVQQISKVSQFSITLCSIVYSRLRGRVLLQREVSSSLLMFFFILVQPSLVGMEVRTGRSTAIWRQARGGSDAQLRDRSVRTCLLCLNYYNRTEQSRLRLSLSIFIDMLPYKAIPQGNFQQRQAMVKCINLPKEEQQKWNQSTKVRNSFVKDVMKYNNRSACKRVNKPVTKSSMGRVVNEENLKCPICLNVMISPALTKCGHSFCLGCIEELFLKSIKQFSFHCPICRTQLQLYETKISASLNAAIALYIQNHADSEVKQNHSLRLSQFQSYETSRQVKVFQTGSYIDFFDEDQAGWINGKIVKIQFGEPMHIVLEAIYIRTNHEQAERREEGQTYQIEQRQFHFDSRRIASEFAFSDESYEKDLRRKMEEQVLRDRRKEKKAAVPI